MKLENLILKNLLTNEKFIRCVLPHLNVEYFKDKQEQVLFLVIKKYFTNYNAVPDQPTVLIEIENIPSVSEQVFKDVIELVDIIYSIDSKEEYDWILEQTEKWCKDRAVYNGLMQAISIINEESKDLTPAAIPDILQNALSVSFDTTVGHDFISDAEQRYDALHKKENKIPFGLKYFDLVTKGGLSRKTLTVFVAGTGGGKSLAMSHFAASQLALGKNVLYISLEMSEQDLAERIEANLLNMTTDDLHDLPKDSYMKKMDRLKEKVKGKLIFKEYPSNAASTLNFKRLLEELKQKKNFKPDIIYVDYLNICASYRLKSAATLQSYNYVKAVAEELRALASEYDVPVVTGSQINRSGYGDSEGELDNISDSMGTAFTADIIFMLYQNEELEQLGQMLVKRLKHRKGDLGRHKKFIVGINKSKMKLFDVEDSAQAELPKPESSNIIQNPIRIKKPDKSKLFEKFKQ